MSVDLIHSDKPPTPETNQSSKTSNLLQKWHEELSKDYYNSQDQRDRGDRNLRFTHVPGGQWDGSDEQNFQNRIRLEFNKVATAVHKFGGESQSNRKTVMFRPESDEDKGTARILNGLFKKDFRRSGGENSYDDSIDEMATAAVGAYRLTTERMNPEDLEDERQRVQWQTLYNAYKTVIWESNAKELDKSDARRCNVLTSYTESAFEEEFPGFQVSSVSFPEENNQFSHRFRWRSNTEQFLYVAERYEIKKKKKTAIVLDNRETGERKVILEFQLKDIEDDLKDQGFRRVGKRKVLDCWVEKAIYSGTQMIEPPTRISGKLIPIIMVYGYRIWVDDTEFVTGLMDNYRDAQRLINMVMSRYAEIASTNPTEVPIFTSEQVAGLQKKWADQHKGNKPYAEINPVDGPDGSKVPAGPVGFLKPPAPDQHGQLTLDYATTFIREETAGAPQDFSDPDASGVAIEQIIERANMDQKPLFTNIERSLVYCGKVYRSIRSEIAGGDEKVTLLAQDNTESQATINETVLDEETGRIKTINDIGKGDFETVVDTGASFSSQRKETVHTLGKLIQDSKDIPAMQEYTPVILNALISNLDGVGLEPVQKTARRIGLIQGFIEPETPEDEQIVQQAQEQANQPDQDQEAQNALFQATAQKEQAEAEERQSKVVLNMANADKAKADTQKTLAGIGVSQGELQQKGVDSRLKAGSERDKIRAQIFSQAQQGQRATQ